MLDKPDIFKKKPRTDIKWGATFSEKYCYELGIDPSTTFNWLLDNYNFKSLRIGAYWDLIEKTKSNFDFTNLNKFLNQASDKGIELTLSIGRKVPRYPEYHDPDWALSKDKDFLYENFFLYFHKLLDTYSNDNRIKYLQVENEPYFSFGETKFGLDLTYFEEEIKLTRSKSNKKIIVTDSGEWSDWKDAAKLADRVGVNIYTKSYNKEGNRYQEYKRAPEFYTAKAEEIKKEIFIAELQAEPWGPLDLVSELTLKEAKKSMNVKRLKGNVKLGEGIGFPEAWMWGVEWWYFIKNDYPQFIEMTKEIINLD
ncbi:hypothetical protein KC660_02530 [Candidatus Dojkabacteria bacterium]|uniref:Glycoside hydrolase family 5 domain-containing protein n=1 Tax=Candidatus Dojkabacteria bacterium TaxID=2099670 RepID=A0A955L3M8_9BACT|nr:hypothetical protein [Candidatus Dojkabacteria bacterium]